MESRPQMGPKTSVGTPIIFCTQPEMITMPVLYYAGTVYIMPGETKENNIGGKKSAFFLFTRSCREERENMFLSSLRSEVRTFLSDANSAFAHRLTDSEWSGARLAYLSCIFDKLNTLNLSLRDLNTNILTHSDNKSRSVGQSVR